MQIDIKLSDAVLSYVVLLSEAKRQIRTYNKYKNTDSVLADVSRNIALDNFRVYKIIKKQVQEY